MAWDLYLTDEVDQWLDDLAISDRGSYTLVVAAIDVLAEVGPNLSKHLYGWIKRVTNAQHEGTAPGSAGSSEVRVMLTFDP